MPCGWAITCGPGSDNTERRQPMDRRQAMKFLGAAAGIVVGGQAFAAGDGPPETADGHGDRSLDTCADACGKCLRECEACSGHCAGLLAGGRKEHAGVLRLCQDCADLCTAALRLVSRRGPLLEAICETCARACDLCAASCEKFPGDRSLAACAGACRTCAAACREMLRGHGSAGGR